jgi:hypothetical protein
MAEGAETMVEAVARITGHSRKTNGAHQEGGRRFYILLTQPCYNLCFINSRSRINQGYSFDVRDVLIEDPHAEKFCQTLWG